VTDELKYNEAGYRNMVKMSSFKYILVEGPDDKRFLMYLVKDLFGRRSDLKIHGAHQISFGNKLGNRERVEAIAKSISKHNHASRFMGFVDREFREFEMTHDVADLLKKHKITDRLIWSRGHSIENYFFEFTILNRPLRHFSITPYYDDALDLLEQNLPYILKLACAMGLAARECNLLGAIKGSIDWNILQFNSSELTLDVQKWEEALIKKPQIRKDQARNVIDAFYKYSRKISRIDADIIRWLCHGHIGMSCIWASYARCIFEVCRKSGGEKPSHEANNVLKAEETVRFNSCASEWSLLASKKSCEYPEDIFIFLGITSENPI
jgi:hypothetical protein